MRFARSFLALAALCAAAACADGASRITAPSDASHSETADGALIGSGNVTEDGGSGTTTEPTDTSSTSIGGTWIGSGN